MWGCPEAIQHGPADGAGRCPWCRIKYTDARPRVPASEPTSGATLAYRQYYDPDFGALSTAELKRQYLMGLHS